MCSEIPGKEKESDPFVEIRESEYWNKVIPGVKGWTVGELIEKLHHEKLLQPGDTSKTIYGLFAE